MEFTKKELYRIAVEERIKAGFNQTSAIDIVAAECKISRSVVYRAFTGKKSRKKKSKKNVGNVIGVIGDTHLPYEHPDYLAFCAETFKREGVNKVIHIGDLFDNHAMSFHDSEPSLKGIAGERIEVQEKLQPWFDAFPKLTLIAGNHCRMPMRKLAKFGLDPDVYMKPLSEIYGMPSGWKVEQHVIIDNVIYHHGETAVGVNGFRNDAKDRMMNSVSGHVHSNFGVSYTATDHRLVWGMATGCGVDSKNMAFAYGKFFKKKPILGCGVIRDNGKTPLCFPMDLGEKW